MKQALASAYENILSDLEMSLIIFVKDFTTLYNII